MFCQDYLVVDAQGFTRPLGPNGEITQKADWGLKATYLSNVDLLKIDTSEAKVLVGTEDLVKAGQELAKLGVRYVLVY